VKKSILTIAILLATSTSFALDTPDAAAKTSKASAQTQASQKDKEIVAFLIVLNKNEIAAAQVALHKEVNSKVKAFATLMTTQHTQNLEETLKLSADDKIQPHDNAMVLSLKKAGKKELGVLTPLTGTAFEKAYINAMVKGHADALVIIDKQLTQVTNPDLKKHLIATRAHVVHHLEDAKAVQKDLAAS